jgi:hypothetical protein
VSESDPLAQGEGEAPEAYLGRLEAIDASGLDADGQTALALSLRLARKQLGGSPLERCMRAVLALSPGDRRKFVRWVTRGMKDATEQAEGRAKARRGGKKA